MAIYRIAHFSDPHLGYRSSKFIHPVTGVNLREQDGYDAFNEVINQIINYNKNEFKIDAVINSGDLFHSPEPSVYTIIQAQKGLLKFYHNNLPVYTIAGNHDATDSIRDIPSNGVVNIPELKQFSYTEPYVKNEILPDLVCHFVSHHGYLEQEKTFKQVNPVEGKFNLLVTHGSVFDTALNEILHSEDEPREVVISEELMSKNWDYTIMGHIHERGWVHSKDRLTDTSNRKQFYGGSLIRRGFADKECRLGRGWTLWTIDTEEKTMIPTFFYINQRFQKDIIIFCENKTPEEITKNLKEELDKIDFSQAPILRATMIDLAKSDELQIDWKSILEVTKQCLSFSRKIKTKEEFKKEISSYNFSFDLLTAYKEFWELFEDKYDEKLRKKIKKTTEALLKKGQDKVMS